MRKQIKHYAKESTQTLREERKRRRKGTEKKYKNGQRRLTKWQ